MLTKSLNKWKSVREIDVSYNNLDIRSVKLISLLMKENRTIIRFEMAPLLDVELSEEEDIWLQKYFTDLDNCCHRNYQRIHRSPMASQDSDENSYGALTSLSTPKIGITIEKSKDSPSSIMIQRSYSFRLLNLQKEVSQIVEILDTYDCILKRSMKSKEDENVLHVRIYHSTLATFSGATIL